MTPGDEGPTMVEVFGSEREIRTCARCGKQFETYWWDDRRHCNIVCAWNLNDAEDDAP